MKLPLITGKGLVVCNPYAVKMQYVTVKEVQDINSERATVSVQPVLQLGEPGRHRSA